MSEGLKPCPFCGSQDVRYVCETDERKNDVCHVIRCDDCYARSGQFDYYGPADAAYEAWNLREWPHGSIQWAIASGKRFRRAHWETWCEVRDGIGYEDGRKKEHGARFVDIVALDWEVER